MPTEAIIERAKAAVHQQAPLIAAWQAEVLARAALAAALPTPEEHARGIEAALAAYSGAMEENRYSMHTTIGMAIAAYLAAVGLTP